MKFNNTQLDDQLVQKIIDMKVDFEPSTSSDEKTGRTGTLTTLAVVALFFLWLIAETGNVAVLILLARLS